MTSSFSQPNNIFIPRGVRFGHTRLKGNWYYHIREFDFHSYSGRREFTGALACDEIRNTYTSKSVKEHFCHLSKLLMLSAVKNAIPYGRFQPPHRTDLTSNAAFHRRRHIYGISPGS